MLHIYRLRVQGVSDASAGSDGQEASGSALGRTLIALCFLLIHCHTPVNRKQASYSS